MEAEKTICINEINPNIRYASYHDLEPGYDSGFRHLRHYQMIYIVKGKGEFVTPSSSSSGEKGDLFIWPSQEAHKILSSYEFPLTVIGLQFDLTKDKKDLVYPISWLSPKKYNEGFANENIKISEISQLPNVFHVGSMSFYESMMFELVREYNSKLANSRDICESILRTLLIYTFRNYIHFKTNRNRANMQEIIRFINKNINRNLTNKEISNNFNYHPNHLNRMFTKATNLPLHQFVMDARLNKAIEYIQTTDLTLTQISDKLSFSSIHHLSKMFKERTGLPPSNLRNKQ